MNKKYNGALDFWKFIFCIVILLFHIGETFGDEDSLFKMGKYAVEFFFIVSGYFMCVSAFKPENERTDMSLGKETILFVIGKIKRILPAYIYCYILGLIVWFKNIGINDLHENGMLSLIMKCIKMVPNFLLLSMSGVYGTKVVMITWYISAMHIAMMVIYPLLRKYKDMYTLVIAPLVVMVLSGYMYNVSGYNGYDRMVGVLTQGVLRAFIGLSIGCIAYMIAGYLREKNFSRAASIALFVVEILLYALVLFMMNYGDKSCVYYNNIFLLAAVSITASKKSAVSRFFDNKVSAYLGQLSLYIYLCQSPVRSYIKYMGNVSYEQGICYVVLLTMILAVGGMAIIRLLRKPKNEKTSGDIKAS